MTKYCVQLIVLTEYITLTHICAHKHMSRVNHLLKRKDYIPVELHNYSSSGVISKVTCCNTMIITRDATILE